MIAEIVSLSGYESRVSALLNEEERLALKFFIACAPEDHPVFRAQAAFAKPAGRGGAKGRVAAFVWSISF